MVDKWLRIYWKVYGNNNHDSITMKEASLLPTDYFHFLCFNYGTFVANSFT